MWDLQFSLESRIPRKIKKVLEHKRFRAAYDFLWLRSEIGEASQELVEWWTRIQEVGPEQQRKMISELRDSSPPRPRNRKRRRKKSKKPAAH